MTADDVAREAAAPLVTPTRRWSQWPAAVRIGIIYLAARLMTTAFLGIATTMAAPTSRFGKGATIGDYLLGWDAQWYWFTALNGYPSSLPLTGVGQVAENQWAFMPLFAYLAQGIGVVFGSWGAGAVIISLVAGYFSSLVLYRMMRLRLDRSAATWAVLFFACGPLAAIFQIGYAESLFLLWLFLALWMLMRRNYVWLYLLIPLMAATRPGVLAFALLLGLHGIGRWWHRRQMPLPGREAWHIVALAALATVCGFAWQVVAGIVTGNPDAYLATELAWRRNWISDASADFSPFHGFLEATAFWFTTWGLNATIGYIVLAALVLGIAAVLLFEPHVKKLGLDLRLWTASYLLYLLAVFFPQSSIFRLLLPISPLWGAVAVPRSRVWRGGVLVACLVGQWWWIYNVYALSTTYWQIP